jgi:hypothetical protein
MVASTTQLSMGAVSLTPVLAFFHQFSYEKPISSCPELDGRQSVLLSKLMPIQDSLVGAFFKELF